MAVRKLKTDPAHEETEKILAGLEKRIKKEYAQAEKELQSTIDDYFERFRLKDQKWQEWVKDGKKTKAEYQQWRVGQMAVGQRWESLKDTISYELADAERKAFNITKGTIPDIYAENFNYGTYEVEMGAKVDTSFNLYDRNTVNEIMKKDPDLLPPPGKKVSKEIAEGKAVRWNKQQVQSVMIQGILQGDSIPDLAKRLAKQVGDSDEKASIRNARTMATGAQNAGRVDSYKRAEDLGINMEEMWRATLDMRTRHEHRLLDGQRVKVGKPFMVDGYEIMFPGDPSAPGYLIYNCRCTLRAVVAGLEPKAIKLRDTSAIGNMSYDEWKAQKKSESNPITLQKEKGETIAESFRNEYRGTGNRQEANTEESKKTDIKIQEFSQYEDFVQSSQDYADRMSPKDIKKFNKIFESAEYVESNDGSYYNPSDNKIYISQDEANGWTMFHEGTHWHDYNQNFDITENYQRKQYLLDENGDLTGDFEWVTEKKVIKKNAGFSEYIAHEWDYYEDGMERTLLGKDMENFVTKVGTTDTYGPNRNYELVIQDRHAIDKYLKDHGVSKSDPDFPILSDFISAMCYDANMASVIIGEGGHSYVYWTESTVNRVAEITAGFNLLNTTGRQDFINIEKDLAPHLMNMIEKEWKRIW